MHHHSLLFSAICKCAYVVAEDDPNQPQNKNQCLPDTTTIAGDGATAAIITTSTALSSNQRGEKPHTKVPLTISRKSQDNHSTKSSDRASSPSKLVIKKGKLKRRVTIALKQSQSSDSSSVDNSGAGDGGGGQESDWPPFADEDYIVFCFEEDGEFHVVTDDCSRSQSIDHIQSPRISNSSQQVHDDNEGHSSSYGHDYVNTNLLISSNRRDYLLPNKAVEEERFYFSPRLQSDGIKSSTRFKDEGGYDEEDDEEEIDMVKARNRVEDMECEEDIMDGIKHRGEINEEQEADDEADDNMEDLEEDHLDCRGLSMDCHNGSVESNGSSRQSDTHRYKSITDQPIIISRSDLSYSSPPLDFHGIFVPSSMDDNNNNIAMRRDGLLSNHDMIDEEEESVYLSSESQQNGSRQSYEEGFCSNNDDDDESRRESTHETTTDSSETGDTDADRMDKDYEEITVLSIASSRSDSSTSSFEFPVLQGEWIGSPVTWPRSATVRYRKQKSPRVSLRCCKF